MNEQDKPLSRDDLNDYPATQGLYDLLKEQGHDPLHPDGCPTCKTDPQTSDPQNIGDFLRSLSDLIGTNDENQTDLTIVDNLTLTRDDISTLIPAAMDGIQKWVDFNMRKVLTGFKGLPPNARPTVTDFITPTDMNSLESKVSVLRKLMTIESNGTSASASPF